MSDRDKVIKILNDTLTAKENYSWAKAEMSFDFIRMILSMLKEQEAVEPSIDIARNRRCPKCFTILKGRFCHECGQAVKWE